MTSTLRLAAAATLAAGLFAALPAAAQTAPTNPTPAQMRAGRADPAALATAMKKRNEMLAKQAAAAAKLKQAQAQMQKRLADTQARLAQARTVR
jgi:hypothetical protein